MTFPLKLFTTDISVKLADCRSDNLWGVLFRFKLPTPLELTV